MTKVKRHRGIRGFFAGIVCRLYVFAMIWKLPPWLLQHVVAAQILGWNELAKMQIELSQKAICRAMRAATIRAAKDIGIKAEHIPSFHGNPTVLEIEMPGHSIPPLEFRESDWELMRVALAKHDQETANQ